MLPFPVTGIGASAGGIEAVGNLLQKLPADTGSAFLVVLHLDPDHESHLAEVLGRETKMPVDQIEDGMSMVPNHVYVIAPDRTLTIEAGRLRLTQPVQPRALRRPIDELFQSLAAAAGERAVAVVLSGTGTNGSAGLAEVRARDGAIFVQDPATAKFDGMPRSAIETGLVDQVLAPGEIAEAVAGYTQRVMAAGEPDFAEGQFGKVLDLLHDHTQLELRNYRRPTLARRMNRRMAIRGSRAPAEYVALLREDADEREALTNDLMISVTSFFRDPESWEALGNHVVEPLVQSREPRSEVRCWVTACSSGEEAYSLAILLTEYTEAASKRLDIRIFGTDLSATAISRARAGLFPDGISLQMSRDRLERFFTREDGRYRVSKSIREMVTFAPHNLLADPPFSRLDIATCRNVLIYLEPEAQRKVLAMLHFALRPAGALMLGAAESAERNGGHFRALDSRHKVYRRVGSSSHRFAQFPSSRSTPRQTTVRGSGPHYHKGDIGTLAMQVLANQTEAAVLLDAGQRVVYFHGATDRYLAHPGGRPNMDIYGMARPGLEGPVRSIVTVARSDKQRSAAEVMLSLRGEPACIHITATPLEQDGLVLLTFQQEEVRRDRERKAPKDTRGAVAGDADDNLLKEELRQSHAELARTVDDLERSNDELTASNEEVMSINEELQSTNEELETSKEELQSLNEELATVNTQLQTKLDELETTTNNLSNLLKSSDIATLFLSRDMKVMWFTPAIGRLFSLIESDIGRPITDFSQKLVDSDITEDCQQVLDSLVPTKTEVQDQSSRWYMRYTTPYRTGDDKIEGVVITYVDITDNKRAERKARQAASRARKAAAAKDEFLARLSHELRTPLQPALLGLSALAGRDDLPDDATEKIGNITRNIEIEIRLIDDLLDLTRVDHGRLRLRREYLDALDLVEDTVRLCEDEVREKEQQVRVEGAPGESWLQVDRIRIQQVIWNLLRNAVRFTRKGGTITIRCKHSGDRVMVEVVDDGVGIPARLLPRIFDSFERSDTTFSGLGLGLSIAKSLVEAHEGTIEAESEGKGRGATFRVSLPAASPPEGGADAGRQDTSTNREQADLAGMRILVIEDHPDSARLLASLLEAAGSHAKTAGTVKQALETVQKETFDVILSDLALPDGNAHEFIDRLPRDIPVIAVSGFGAPQDIGRSMDTGFAEHLVKPVTLADLRAAISRALA